MTASLIVRWPVLHPDEARMWDLEREARAEWPGHVAAAGLWATTDPVFQLHDTDDAGGLELIGAAEAILGPIEPLSWRTP